jgi:tripartite-type tricarboxylate transporter receptor subunit TctC
MTARRPIRLAFQALVLALASAGAGAQTWPEKPVRVIVPVGPGGGFDLLARTVAPALSERLGQPVLVENRPGAGSLVGTELVAKSPADGYTMLIGGVTNMAINGGIYKSLPYDPVADFRPVMISVSNALCLVARKDLPQSTLQEAIAFARQNPDKLSYASAGVGTAQHITGALLAVLGRAPMVHIPYKGAGAAQQDVMGGRVDMMFNTCGIMKPLMDSGALKPLATSGKQRMSILPNLPTVMETGVANFDFDSWIGFFVAAKTPTPIVERLRREIVAIVTAPDYVARVEKDGGRVWRLSLPETEAFVKAEAERWKQLIPQAGIPAE